ncbi:GNAT family N-acetyltransferase [Pseudogemmobacter blasticus]|uniref:GNAT family N-acetyltransferase n=1 Tax=Fuscovulum blasticum DSM 2131 TaxID=1188250 RepID=A0A2T4J6P3_FUSBL|nr:GNAT family protein [Fuscovulum blasticum]PTE13523.1 GNAT family N-acetyltransferase [Fuscovulum blasticum DSM 2131]
MQPIETERLILRNFREDDAEGLFAYLRAPVSGCFLDLKLADLAAARTDARARSGDDQQIAVALKGTDQLVGDLFAHREAEELDTVSVGWNFNPAFAGRGYAFEAARALFDQLFGLAGARRLYAYVEDHNTRSRRLCERLGMRQEGTFVEYITFRNDAAGNPIYENTMQYAILRREWAAR